MKIQFNAQKFIEKDKSVTLSLNEMDLIENGADEEEVKRKLAFAILEYAKDFCNDLELWSSSKNRREHIPIVTAVKDLDIETILENIKIY